MNAELGYGRRVLETLERRGISFEHLPSGIDTVSVVVNTADISSRQDAIVADLKRIVRPDAIRIDHNLALIAIVGRGMICSPGVAARVFSCPGKRTDQCSDDRSGLQRAEYHCWRYGRGLSAGAAGNLQGIYAKGRSK